MEERMVRRRVVVSLLALILVTAGCAVQRTQAPQLKSQTITELNIAAQLKQANADYIQFFTDLGKQVPQPTAATLAEINGVGHGLKTTLDTANGLWQTYNTNHDASLPAQISALLVTASADMAVLLAKKAGK